MKRLTLGQRRWILALACLLLLSLSGGCNRKPTKVITARTTTMMPLIRFGDSVEIDNQIAVKRWDIVAFRDSGGETQVGRVIGLPTERITFTLATGEIRANGQSIEIPRQLAQLVHALIKYEGGINGTALAIDYGMSANDFLVMFDTTQHGPAVYRQIAIADQLGKVVKVNGHVIRYPSDLAPSTVPYGYNN